VTRLGFDPLSVLGCDEEEFRALMHGRPVTPGEVEAAARQHYRWREHRHDDDSYWVTVPEAARIMGVSPRAVRRLIDAGRLPHLTHVSGVHLVARVDAEALARDPGTHTPGTRRPAAMLPTQATPRRGG
jgi:excisionase family DNA binding protein